MASRWGSLHNIQRSTDTDSVTINDIAAMISKIPGRLAREWSEDYDDKKHAAAHISMPVLQ